MSSIKIF